MCIPPARFCKLARELYDGELIFVFAAGADVMSTVNPSFFSPSALSSWFSRHVGMWSALTAAEGGAAIAMSACQNEFCWQFAGA